MNIFTIRDDVPTITPEGLFIPEMRKIWEADDTENKTKAHGQLAYVYHMASWSSSYSNLGPERHKEVSRDFLGGIGKSRVTKEMTQAITKYKKLQETPEVRALDAALVMLDNLSLHFHNVDFDALDDEGKPIYDVRKYVMNLKDLQKMVESVVELRKTVERGLAEMGANNGIGVVEGLMDELLDE